MSIAPCEYIVSLCGCYRSLYLFIKTCSVYWKSECFWWLIYPFHYVYLPCLPLYTSNWQLKTISWWIINQKLSHIAIIKHSRGKFISSDNSYTQSLCNLFFSCWTLIRQISSNKPTQLPHNIQPKSATCTRHIRRNYPLRIPLHTQKKNYFHSDVMFFSLSLSLFRERRLTAPTAVHNRIRASESNILVQLCCCVSVAGPSPFFFCL